MRDIRNESGILSETMRGVSGLGRMLTFTVTTPLLALGSAAVQTAGKFDAAMRNINAIAGLSESQLADLTQQTLEFGKATRSGAIESAGALYTVFSAGITDTADAFTAMEWSVRTAEAGLADLETTTEALVASMLSYGDTSEEFAERASNSLTAMVAVGVGSMENFANAVGNVLPTASALGMSIEELYGDMAFLTQRGLSAAKASTSMNAALTSLVKPTEAMQAAFQSLGVNGAEELIDKFGGVNGALQALIGTTDGTQAELQQLFNNIRGARAINLFANDIDGWNASMEEFYNTLDGATMRAWEQQMMSFEAQFGLFTSAIEGAAIAIGNAIIPLITPIMAGLTEIINGFSALSPEVLQLGTVFASAVALGAPLLWLLGSLISPIGVLIGGIAALATAFVTNFGGIRDTVITAVESVTGDLQPLVDIVDDFMSSLFPDEPEVKSASDFVTFSNMTPKDAFSATISPTSQAISLWSYYEDEGFIDKVSWQDFMDIALEGGWDGGAIEVGEEIVLNFDGFDIGIGQETIPQDLISMEEFELWGNNETNNNSGMAQPFINRVIEAFQDVQPQLEQELGRIVTNITTWLTETGVPLLAEGVGYFVGKMGVMIGQGLGAVGDWIGNAFSGAGDTAGEVGSYLDENVAQPFSEGFGNALGEAEVDGIGDSILTGVAGALALYATANFMIFGGAASSIMKALGLAMNVASLAWTGASTIMSFIATRLGIAAVTSQGFSYTAGFIVSKLGTSLATSFGAQSFLTSVSSALGGGIQSAVSMLTSSGALSLGAVAVSMFILFKTLEWAFDPAAVQQTRDDINEALTGLFNDFWVGSGRDGSVDVDFNRAFEDTAYMLLGMFDPLFNDMVGNKGVTFFDDMGNEITREMALGIESATPIEASPNVTMTLTTQQQHEAWQEVATQLMQTGIIVDGATVTLAGGLTPDEGMKENWSEILNGADVDFSGSMYEDEVATLWDFLGLDPAKLSDDMDMSDSDPITPPPVDTTPIIDQTTETVDAIATRVASEALDGQDSTAFIEDFLVPIEDKWTGMYAEGGSLPLAYNFFATGVQTKTSEMITGMTTGFVVMAGASAIFAGALTLQLGMVENAFMRGVDAVKHLKAEIAGLMAMSVSVDVDVQTGVSSGAPQLAVGANYIPYDGFPAWLHKGEMVVPAKDAELLRGGGIPTHMATVGVGSSGGRVETTENNNQFNIYANNFDDIVREAKRRGVNLGV